MITAEVASDELRAMVKRLAMQGLPEQVPVEEALEQLDDNQLTILGNLSELAEQERAIAKEGEKATEGDPWWQIRMQMRTLLQQAILAGMTHVGIVQRHVVGYGAIPSAREKWKYFLLPDGNYACWQCGAEILEKDQAVSVHFAELPLAGGGEVRHRTTVFCPNCDGEPSDHAIVTETVAESIARDMR
jgi:hypothetical protein